MKMQSGWRLAGFLAAGVVLFIFVVVALLHTPPAKRYALRQAQEFLWSQGLELNSTELRYNLLTLSATLNDPVLRSSATPQFPPFFKANHLRVDLSLTGLIQGLFVVQDVQLKNVAIQIVVDEQGRSNLPTLPSGEPGQPSDRPAWQMVSSLKVEDGSVLFEDRQSGLQLAIPRWEFTMTLHAMAAQHHLRFKTLRKGQGSFKGQQFPIEEIALEAVLGSDRLQVRNLALSAAGAKVDAAGSLDHFADPALDFRFNTGLDLGRLARHFPIRPVDEGQISADMSLVRSQGTTRISGLLRGQQISAAGYDQIGFETRAVWDAESKLLRLEDLSARLRGGTIDGKVVLDLLGDHGSNSIQAQVRNLDIQPITRFIDLPIEIASQATGTVSLRWKSGAAPTGEADIQLASMRSRPAPDVLPLAGSFSLRSSGEKIALSIGSAAALGASLQGKVSIRSQRHLDGELAGSVVGLAPFAESLGLFLGRDGRHPLLPLKVGGAVNFQATVQGTTSDPRLLASVQTLDLQLGGVQDLQLVTKTELDRAKVAVRDLNLTWAGQRLRAQGELGLQSSSPSLDFRGQIESGSLGSTLAKLGKNIPAEGVYQAEFDLGGTIKEPRADVTLLASDLKAYGESMGNLRLKAHWVEGRAELTELHLEKHPAQKNEGYLKAQGNYHLESQEYAVQAEISNMKFNQLLLPGASPLHGIANLLAVGKGNLDDPQLRVQLEVSDLNIGNQLIGAVNATANLENEQAILELKIPRFNLVSTARARTRLPYPSEFDVAVNKFDLSIFDLRVAEGEPLGGTLSASVKGSGELSNWKAGEMAAQVSQLELSTTDHQIRNQGTVGLTYQDGVLNVEQAVLASEDSRIQMGGFLPVDATHPPGILEVSGNAEIDTLLAFVPLQEKAFASGLLDFNVSLQGSFDRLTPSVDLSLKEGFFYSPSLIVPFTEIGLAAQLQKGSFVVTRAQGQWALGEIQASGEFPLGLLPGKLPIHLERKSGPARFALEARDLQADAIHTLPRGVTGTVSVHIEGEAPRLNLSALSANVVFDELRFQVAQYVVAQAEPSRISVRDGSARIDQLELTGPTTQVKATGRADLRQPRTIDLQVKAALDAGVFTLMAEDLRAGGETQIQLGVRGQWDSPALSGFLQTRQGQFSLRSPEIRAENLDLLFRLAPGRVSVEEFTGNLNGGNLRVGGTIDYSGTSLKEVDLDISMKEIFLNIPEGLKTSVSAELEIQSPENSILIAGTARILEGTYRDRVELGGEFLRRLTADGPLELAGERSALLSRVRYDIAISTDNPILVDNNLAKVAAEGNLRLVGTYYRPALTGRMTLEEGGEIYLSERKYLIERGTLDFISQNKIEPLLDILAKTQAGGEDIDLQVSGSFGDLTTNLTSPSDPNLSEPDIVSLLLTGRTLEEFRGAELNVAKEQVLSYLAGSVGGRISRTAERSLGLSQVRIEPNLIAAESDPGARLTVGQEVTRNLRLIYSMDLTDSQDQIWTAEYDVTRRFEAKATKQSDNSYRLDFRHDLRFGGQPAPGRMNSARSQAKKRITDVEFLGKPLFSDKQLAGRFKLKVGDDYDFFKVQNGLDRVQNFYALQGHPEVKIRLNREAPNSQTALKLNINPGPKVEFIFKGQTVAGETREKIEQAWREGVFDAQRVEASIEIIRAALLEEDYLQPKVTHSIQTQSDDHKQVVFQIEPGTRYRPVELVLEGASTIAPSRLKKQIEAAKLEKAIYLDPSKVTDFLKAYYRQEGYLDAEIQPVRYELDAQSGSGQVVIPIQEGTLYKVGKLEFRGNQVLSDTELSASIPFSSAEPYHPQRLVDSTSRLEELYWSKGYNDVLVRAQPQRTTEGLLDVVFEIMENRQGVIEEVRIEGNDGTSEGFVRGRLKFAIGDPLDFEKIHRSRKGLYDTGTFSLVDMETEAVAAPARDETSKVKRVRVTVKLREIQPYQVRYGGFYDTERGPGIIVDATTRNFLGSARLLGLRTRYDSQTRELRGYFSQPFVRDLPLKTNATIFRLRESPENVSFITDRVGFSLQQQAEMKNKFILSYGYRFETTHTFDTEPDPLFPFDITLPVARLTGTLARDTRDDLLDAAHGSFTSHAFEFAPRLLGSDVRFVKYFGQYFKYLPLSQPREIPWNSGLKKSRFVYASGVRAGFAKGLGDQIVIPSERFFAGGGTTIRGFHQNALGPVDFFGDPIGGEAVFLTNNEIRFPIVHIFDGVGFLDIGNVYATLSDFNPFEVRKSAGIGLRVRTPFFLLRADYGWKLDPRPGESRGGFFFSIGQAF